MRPNSLVEDAEIKNNFNVGVATYNGNLSPSPMTIRRCNIHSNGSYGFNFTIQVSGNRQYNSTIEYCELANNNTRHLDIGHDSGCSKMLSTTGSVAQYNWVHDNYGSGLWWDGFNEDVLCQENVCEDNRNWGIFYELSWGGSTITHNALFRQRAGGRGIR